MADDKKDFKEVKVKISGGQKDFVETLDRSMLFSGVNIFGQLTELYMAKKGNFEECDSPVVGTGSGSQQSAMNLESSVLQIFKKMQKRDSITKVKAFAELREYWEKLQDEQTKAQRKGQDTTEGEARFQNMMTFFLFHMCRILLNENDKKVREAAHETLTTIIKTGKRRLGPHIKKIFPLWFASFFDPSPDVARLAKKNFQTAFPEEKQPAIFKIAYKQFLHFANEQLKMSDNDEEKDSAERVTSVVLMSLASCFEFVQRWKDADEKDHFQRKLAEILDLEPQYEIIKEAVKPAGVQAQGGKRKQRKKNAGAEEEPEQADEGMINTVVKAKQPPKKRMVESHMWTFLKSGQKGRVRAACLQFVAAFITHMPHDLVKEHVQQLAPLVFDLVSEPNSFLQGTLWKDAIFTLGVNFPEECWKFIQIKKNFIPKLHTCLKAAGFGSPVALYQNFVKFVSIFPLFKLMPTDVAHQNETDQKNKASFKERCNLVRETMQNMYGAIKSNEEAVAFHADAVDAFFQTLTFILLKRVQPLTEEEAGVSEDDQEFCLAQIKKVVQMPVEDFVAGYEKMGSKVQNTRNIRVTVPAQLVKMLVGLAERNFNEEMFFQLCTQIKEAMTPGSRNSARIISEVVKALPKIPEQYAMIVSQNIVGEFLAAQIGAIDEIMPNISKDTISEAIDLCQNLCRVLYTLNKEHFGQEQFEERAAADFVPDLEVASLIKGIMKKEEMAKKFLTKEMLEKFMTIKKSLVEATVLFLNGGWDRESLLDSYTELLQDVILKPSIDGFNSSIYALEEIIFMPERAPTVTGSKVDFKMYFERIRDMEKIHELMFGAMSVKMLGDQYFIHYQHLVEHSIRNSVQDASLAFLSEADCDQIRDYIIQHLDREKIDLKTISGYFTAIKALVCKQDEQNEELRVILFAKLQHHRVTRSSEERQHDSLWAIFVEAVAPATADAFREQCLGKLSENLSSLIAEESSNTLLGVEQFQHQTKLIKKFAIDLYKVEERTTVVRRILLRQENFARIEKNSLPLKMFKDLFLSGGIAFDTQDLLGGQNEAGQFEYVWLAATFLNFKHLPSLSSFMELKKQLVIFVETDVVPALICLAKIETKVPLIIHVCKELANRACSENDVGQIRTLEYLIQVLVDPGEDFPADEKPVVRIDDFKQIFREIALGYSQMLTKSDFQTEEIGPIEEELLVRILKKMAYFLGEEEEIIKLYNSSFKNLSAVVNNPDELIKLPRVTCQIQAYLGLCDWVGSTETAVFKIKLMNALLAEQSGSQLQLIAIQLCGELLDQPDKVQLLGENINKEDLHSSVMDVLEAVSEQKLSGACEAFIALCRVVRKTVDWTVSGPAILGMLIQCVKEKAISFDAKMDDQLKNMSGKLEPFEFEMLQEMAETLLMCPAHLTETLLKANIEDNLYYLVGCSVEPLQKAAYVLLRFIYENFVPPVEYVATVEQELLALQNAAQNEPQQEESKEEKHEETQAFAFKNVSKQLLRMIENPPNFAQEGFREEQIDEKDYGGSQLEQLIFGESVEGSMSNKTFGFLLTWNSLLSKIEQGRIKSQLAMQLDQASPNPYGEVLSALTDHLEAHSDIYQMMLLALVPFLPEMRGKVHSNYKHDLAQFAPEYMTLADIHDTKMLVLTTLINFMKSFPSSARKFYTECDKHLTDIMLPYIRSVVSPAILENEIKKIELSQTELGMQSELTFQLFRSTNEIIASYAKSDEISAKITLRIPPDYPLKSVVVDIGDQLKLKSQQVRKWTLSIRNLIQSRNGDIISAILLWKSNIDQEMAGVEECYICYSVLHANDRSIPSMQCRNCKNKFHVACIRKWFNSSNKSNCPLCQTFFFQ